MRIRLAFKVLGSVTMVLAGCAAPAHSRTRAHTPAPAPRQHHAADPVRVSHVVEPVVPVAAPEQPKPSARAHLMAWLRERLPAGGEIGDGDDRAVTIAHTTQGDKETLESVARKYLDLTDVYFGSDLAIAIAKTNGTRGRTDAPLKPGVRLAIPHLLAEPYKTGDAERLGWPEDGKLTGLYLRGDTAGRSMFVHILDRMQERGINLVSIDAKDYDGMLTYPSKVPLAIEAGVIKHPPIRDLARTIRFVHQRGIRVAVRVSCFEDEVMAKAKPDLAVRAKWGGPYKNGWMDPSNEAAQGYIIDLVKEGMDAGADEIQLDYVRYPVLGIKNADFHLPERGLTQVKVVTEFVKKVHAVTHARKVPLVLDVFGVIAHGNRADIEMLGQDPALLASEVEVLSPMVYPSHYDKGFMGWDEPGNHPEIVGIGTKGIVGQIGAAVKSGAVKGGAKIRPWLQANNWKSTNYSPAYIATEIKTAEDNGGTGWMMWNPSQEYGYTWQAVRTITPPPAPVATSAKAAKGSAPPPPGGRAAP
jgi:hypothetical protein